MDNERRVWVPAISESEQIAVELWLRDSNFLDITPRLLTRYIPFWGERKFQGFEATLPEGWTVHEVGIVPDKDKVIMDRSLRLIAKIEVDEKSAEIRLYLKIQLASN